MMRTLVMNISLLRGMLYSVAGILFSCSVWADAPAVIRMGVLAGGSASWEVTAAHQQGWDKKAGLDIQTTVLANPDAARIALQGGSVDVIVTDWIWVARQREMGRDFSFYPYSSHQGVLLVPEDSSIGSISDLVGKKLGVVGGGLDKNWLLLRAAARKQSGLDLDARVEKVFGAAPLLQQQFESGQLDALLTQWHYAARLEHEGYRRLLDGADLLREQAIDPHIASLGLVFSEAWGMQSASSLGSLIDLLARANEGLCHDDGVWAGIVEQLQTAEPDVRQRLRSGYCRGRETLLGRVQEDYAQKLYLLLRDVDQKKEGLALPVKGIPLGTFWRGQ